MCAVTATLPTQTMRHHNAVFITNHVEAVIPGCFSEPVCPLCPVYLVVTKRPYKVKLSRA
jgi:hypothetical protein